MERELAVLWVDECVDTHLIYETLLRAIGVQTIAMTTACDTALAVAAATPFHLIIFDAGLSSAHARTVANFIRSGVGASRAARIVLVAPGADSATIGQAGPEDDREDDPRGELGGGLADGAIDAVLRRPVTARALRDEIVAATRAGSRPEAT
jgi:hypothetical protein